MIYMTATDMHGMSDGKYDFNWYVGGCRMAYMNAKEMQEAVWW